MDKTVETGLDSDVGADIETVVNEEASSDGGEDSTNWEELYKKEHSRAENYKTAFSQKREFVKNGATDPVVDETEDNKPITRSEFARMVTETVAPLVAVNKVDSELERQVKDPEKRKLVKLYYETRVRQMGTSDDAIREGISDALAIANKQKLQKAASEIKRKQDMQTSPPLNGSSSEGPVVSKNHKFSQQQVQALTAKAQSLNMNPEKFIEGAWKNQNRG